ncbi:DUF7552 domain-containing protein [Natronomonas sp. EA1]|uniref:DUF7552 domain-containing protein n=1 Tax=Natronomonas sp. EA1 TaxID=3421655 RepID=UPI003EBC738A
MGGSLVALRLRVEALASETGEYAVVCACHGDSPVPADGLRFDDRPTARAAARATRAYRVALRRYDPRTSLCDPLVCHVGGEPRPTAASP